MPEISRFYGIVIGMFYNDHAPPHFHVRYNEFNIVLGIPEGDVLDGALPARQMKLVQAWIELHRDDLMADWIFASSGQTPFKIDPLR